MSTKLIKVGNSFNVPQKTYIANNTEERDNLKAYFGDLCLVIEDGITYILNSENEWHVYPTGGGGGGDVPSEAIAPVYDPVETAYSINSLIMYDGKVWRAKQAIEAPANDFDESKWEQVDIASAKADLINGKVPAAQLPSYVDDVLEYANLAAFPKNGEAGKVYVAIDSGYTYRWSGSDYIAIGTIFNEVHIGTEAPTGDETIWVKPINNTINSKEVGDWLYLDETVDGVTSRVRFKVLSKDETTRKAIIVREGTTTPGFKVTFEDANLNDVIESIYDGDYDNAIKAQYNSSISTNNNITVYDLPYENPLQFPEFIDMANFYSSVQNAENIKDMLFLKVGPANGWTSYLSRSNYGNVIFHTQANKTALSDPDYDGLSTLIRNDGYTSLYIAVAFEIPLTTSLTGLDELADPLANCTIKFKQNDQWNDVNDIHVATVEQLIALQDKIADLRTTTNTSLLSLDGRVTTLEGNQLPTITAEDEGKVLGVNSGAWDLVPAPESSLEAEEMLEVLAETGLIETPGIEYTDYIEDPNGEYLYDEELGEWRLAGENEVGTHRAENCVLIYQEYVEDPNGTYLYDEELGEWRLAGDNETGTHSLGDTYILYY